MMSDIRRKVGQRPDTRIHRLLAALMVAGVAAGAGALAHASSADGVFPTADQVGGQVYPKGFQAGDRFPTDFAMFDNKGKKVDVAQLISGKKTVIAFFISAVPASVEELKKLQDFAAKHAPGAQVLNVNADTVGVALLKGHPSPVDATVSTVNLIAREHKLTNPMFVAPNDALDPNGLSNKLGFRGLPTIFVIDAKGTIAKVLVGPQNWKQGDI